MKFVNNIDEAWTFVKSHVEALEKKAESNIPSVMKMNKITMPSVANVYAANAFKYGSSYYERDPTTVEEVDNKLKQWLAKAETERLKVVEEHQLNIPIIENNQRVREKITQIMKDIGIPNNYTTSEFKTSRSSKKTSTTNVAGYVGDLQRNVPVSDDSERMLTLIKSAVASLTNHADTLKGNIRKQLIEVEKTEKEKKSVRALAVLQVKYGLDANSEWSDVLEAFCEKDKYFKLAHAMEATRNDWNDGYGRVQYAIDSFDAVTEEDKEIFEEIHELAYESEDIDGRVFRDCQFNYSMLYGKVSAELMADYDVLQEYYEVY